MPFKYKKVLVIGATSGIGRALAERLVKEGTAVIATGRRKENLDEFVKSHEKQASLVDSIMFDITDLKGIPAFAESIFSTHPDLDCVLLNSGIQRHFEWQNPEKLDMSVLELEMLTNYTSYMYLTKAFLPFLQRKAPQDTSLIFVTSGLALIPSVKCPSYCASKAALHHMILAMRLQLKEAQSNVKILELLPPAVQTELHDDKHQPEYKGTGRTFGMPLDEFTDEAYAGLNSDDNEQVAVGMTKTSFGSDGWERQRQEGMLRMFEMQKRSR